MGSYAENRQLINRWFSAFSQFDLVQMAEMLTDDVIWQVDGDPVVSTVGLLRGRDNVGRWLADFPRNFMPREFVTEHFYGDENTVLVAGRFRHTVLSTGNTAGSDMLIRFTIRENKICRYQIYEDSALLKRAFTPEDEWQQQQIRVNGTLYRYRDTGEGPVVIFAHGLFLDGEAFREQYQALAPTHRCIVIAMPGHGGSRFPHHTLTLDDITDDIALMISELFRQPVTFIGQSQGGMAGIRLAARYPELVQRLILIGTSARAEPDERIAGWQQRQSVFLTGDRTARAHLLKEIQQHLNSPGWRQQFPEQAAEGLRVMSEQDPQAMAKAITTAVLTRGDIRHLLPVIQIPVLVICGGLDPATPPALSREIAEGMQNGRMEILPESGHHPMLESAQQVTALIKAFLAG